MPSRIQQIRQKFRSAWPGALAVGAVLLLSGCAEGSNSLDAHGVGEADIVGLFWVIFWMAVAVFIVVEGVLVYAIIRFRARPNSPLPRQIHGNTRLEIAWTIFPAVVLLAVLIATFTTMKAIASPVPNALQVYVVGHQWWWEFDYMSGNKAVVVTADELHLPVNQPVTLHITSDDVVHNFWAPELDRKVQAIPGHDNIIPVEATSAGTYNGFCAEFCGTEHALMRFIVVAQSPTDFQSWMLAQEGPPAQPQTADEQAGAKLFSQNGCSSCHQIGSQVPNGFPFPQPGQTFPALASSATPQPPAGLPSSYPVNCVTNICGPNLTHIGSRSIIVADDLQNTSQNMEQWIEDPEAVKPGNFMSTFIHAGQISPQQAAQLTAYLESLK